MSDTAIKEAMDYATNNKLKSAYWEHERTMRDIASALYSREKAGQERGERIGQERGEKIGQERGDKTGRQALSTLLQKLLEEGRKEEFDRVLQDNEYQEKLLKEYHLK